MFLKFLYILVSQLGFNGLYLRGAYDNIIPANKDNYTN